MPVVMNCSPVQVVVSDLELFVFPVPVTKLEKEMFASLVPVLSLKPKETVNKLLEFSVPVLEAIRALFVSYVSASRAFFSVLWSLCFTQVDYVSTCYAVVAFSFALAHCSAVVVFSSVCSVMVVLKSACATLASCLACAALACCSGLPLSELCHNMDLAFCPFTVPNLLHHPL